MSSTRAIPSGVSERTDRGGVDALLASIDALLQQSAGPPRPRGTKLADVQPGEYVYTMSDLEDFAAEWMEIGRTVERQTIMDPAGPLRPGHARRGREAPGGSPLAPGVARVPHARGTGPRAGGQLTWPGSAESSPHYTGPASALTGAARAG